MEPHSQPTIRRLALPCALAVALFPLLMGVPAGGRDDPEGSEPGPSAPIVKTRTIAPGLKYTRIVERQVPRRTFVLTLDLQKAITLDTTLAAAALPARDVLSDIVRRAGALAGVNGDFSGRPVGNPVHPFAQDGELLRTTSQLGSLFAVTRDESATLFGRPEVEITVTETTSGRTLVIDRWNQGDPVPGEIAGFSPLGGTLEPPPASACSARLLAQGPPRLADPSGVRRDYVVDAVGCSKTPLTREGGVVLSAAPATDEAIQLLALTPGTPMTLSWTLGLSGVFDVMGGAPLLLQDGQLTGQCNSGCGRQPRTAVGVTATGKVLLVVIDGRQTRWSLGPTMDELARIMRDLGAVNALNLDGGGSSTMVVEGEVVNRPSDGQQRSISNAIVVLPGADSGDD